MDNLEWSSHGTTLIAHDPTLRGLKWVIYTISPSKFVYTVGIDDNCDNPITAALFKTCQEAGDSYASQLDAKESCERARTRLLNWF